MTPLAIMRHNQKRVHPSVMRCCKTGSLNRGYIRLPFPRTNVLISPAKSAKNNRTKQHKLAYFTLRSQRTPFEEVKRYPFVDMAP